jgi:hypothetical protein
MKKLFALYLLTIWLVVSCAAQGGAGMQRQNPGGALEAAHVGYIIRALNLTPAESQRFWPIYNLYATEIRQAHMAFKVRRNVLEMDEAVLNIKKKYFAQFANALSPERANQFFQAEKDFQSFVQKEMLQRKQMRIQQRRPLMNPGGDTP